MRNLTDDPSTGLDLIAESCDGLELGGIRFGIEERRGKLHLSYTSDLVAGAGALSSKLDELGADLPRYYGWLGDLDDVERSVAAGDAGDRTLVLRLLGELPGARLTGAVW